MNKFKIELITVVCVGKHLKDGNTELEGDSFEFITSFDTLSSMGQDLKSCMSSLVLGNLLAPVVEENGGKNDLSLWGHVTEGRVITVFDTLSSMGPCSHSLTNENCSSRVSR